MKQIAVILCVVSSWVFANTNDPDPRLSSSKTHSPSRALASEEGAEKDLEHYHNMARRIGVELGYLIPGGDFASNFNGAPTFGLHYTWEAIRPFAITMGMMHAASSYRASIATGKLSVTEISIGMKASHPMGRVSLYGKLGAAFLFNHVSFDASRTVTAGNDVNLTTLGVVGGLGVDFIVGRELSLGIECAIHYSVPKTIATSTGNFDLGSPFAIVSIRVNF